MHSYETSRQQSHGYGHVPAMRPAREREPHGGSHTPIYDALCSEYLRAFRALPGDRTGEEDLGFAGFGALTSGGFLSSYAEPWTPWGDRPGDRPGDRYGDRPGDGWQVPSYAGGHGSAYAYAGGRQHQSGTHVPAALPPAPRRGV
ncbi:hypothetical protein [Streptomyces sp. NPDC086023]|uniref:hypothetical protein n=1 Tax=Streptomyces sp. NPDC086023 TaxID=3365746 RepID=UPI0037D3F224